MKDHFVFSVLILAFFSIVLIMVYLVPKHNERTEEIHHSNICGDQHVVKTSTPKGSKITFVLCGDNTVRGVYR